MTQPQQKSGCLPFSLGCLTGVILTFVMLGLMAFGITLFGGYFIQEHAGDVYDEHIRPEIVNNLDLPDAQKQKILKELDTLVREFPQMTSEEKAQMIRRWQDKIKELSTSQ